MENVVKNLPVIALSEIEMKRLSQGQRLSMTKLETPQKLSSDGVYRIENMGKTQGLVRKFGHILSPELIWLDSN